MNTRRRKLLQILLNTNIWMNGASLADIFRVSARTIRTDIKEINTMIAEYGVRIDSDIKRGYFIEPDQKDILNKNGDSITGKGEDAFPQTPEERENYMLYRLLYMDDYLSTEQLATELFVSKATAYLDLKRIEKKFEQAVGCQLIIDSGVGIKVSGKEKDRRIMITNTIRQTNKYDLTFDSSFYYERKIDPQDVEDQLISIYEMLINQLNRYECSMVDKDMVSLAKEVYISLQRIREGHQIKANDKQPSLLMNIINDFCSSLELRFELTINTYERMFIQDSFNSKRLLSTGHSLTLGSSKENDILEEFLSEVKNEYSLDLGSSENFEKNLKTHLGPMIARIQTNQMENSNVTEQIKKKYPFAYVISTKILPIIYAETNVIISETELSYIALHVAVALDDIFVKKDLLVVCGSGFATARLIKKELNSRLSPYVNQINIISYFEFDNLEPSEIKEEIIVTSVPIHKNIKDKPIILVNPILTLQDLKNLEKVIGNVGTIDDDAREELITYFPKELYRIEKQDKSYLALVKTMVMNLYHHKYIESAEKFYESVLEREKIFSTVLDNGIGIPHPMVSMSRESVVSVAIIPEGLKVDDKTVYIVLLFSVNSKELAKLSVLYDYLEYLAEINYSKPLPEELLNYETMIEFLAKKGEI
ncbi:PTS sugar transporter subunit IIA [Erysipelothrix urinaevulpis]|uniref:BglG family transcription antiterminator n=1 Tax=Erysipelothrix urinaevulpis TaxID=2683717 RepID=UPI00135C3B81|nr:PTS sugar transporter subunit IIA [Erysipelothrix urinaevulpis]